LLADAAVGRYARVMDNASAEVLATIAAEKFGDAYGGVINGAMRLDLSRRIEAAIRSALITERQRLSDLCLKRQALWEQTEGRPDTPAPLRAEARSRANEAAYLADVIHAAPNGNGAGT
jgi:hypothetical protein